MVERQVVTLKMTGSNPAPSASPLTRDSLRAGDNLNARYWRTFGGQAHAGSARRFIYAGRVMEQMHIYRMRGLEPALMAAQTLDAESKDLGIGMGLILLAREKGPDDWYLFANLENPRDGDTSRVVRVLSQAGSLSNYTFNQVLYHSMRMFAGSGSFAQIMIALAVLADRDDKLRNEIVRARTAFGGT